MKLMMQREVLLKPLQLLTGVVEKKQTLPILSNVLITVKDTVVSIIGADLDIELKISLPIQNVVNDTAFTVSASKLMDICRALPEKAKFELQYNGKNVFIYCGNTRFTLATLSAEDFPLVNQDKHEISFFVDKLKLVHLLKASSFAMAQQDVRYYLNGMLWEITEKKFKVVSTDGHRMAIALAEMEHSILNEEEHQVNKIIVPRKAILELLRLLDDADDKITIKIGHQHIQILDTKYRFVSKLIDGRFPEYKKVIPQSGDKKIIFDREKLRNALTRISILSNEQLRAVCFQFRENYLCLYANNVEQEIAEEKLEIDYKKENFDIVFNVNYLLDVLNVCQTKTVSFFLKDSSSSILIEEIEGSEKAFFVVMPMCL